MSDDTRVSVIIPHLNTPALLTRCLTSVVDQRLDHGAVEIIVVDNGSTTDMSAVHAAFPTVRFLAEPAPGPGLARNRGIAAARGRTLAFIDADCRAAPGWLQAAVTAVEAEPGSGLFGGDIRIDFADPARPTGIEAFEAVFGFRQNLYIETKHFSVTANLAMAPAVHAAVGGFAGIDKAEDFEWGRRAHAMGFTTRYRPEMRVYHPAREDFAALCTKWRRLIRHEWNAHRAAGGSPWSWRARAAALVVAVPVEAGRFVGSDRISGLGNRWRGALVLARIRWFRAREMLRIMAGPEDMAVWNRSP
jgi:glycosyltransferase involved in cell wall biosynthesis